MHDKKNKKIREMMRDFFMKTPRYASFFNRGKNAMTTPKITQTGINTVIMVMREASRPVPVQFAVKSSSIPIGNRIPTTINPKTTPMMYPNIFPNETAMTTTGMNNCQCNSRQHLKIYRKN